MDNYIDKNTFKIGIISAFLFGWVLGIYGFSLRDSNNVQTVTKTTIQTDTVFVNVVDTVHVTRTEIKHEHIRDTLLIEPINPKIKAFTSSKAFLYGNVAVNGEVLGEVLKMDIYTDFNLPQVTNTITKTNTMIKKPSGLFLTAGVNQQLTASLGAVYVRDRYLLGLSTSGFQVGYRLK